MTTPTSHVTGSFPKGLIFHHLDPDRSPWHAPCSLSPMTAMEAVNTQLATAEFEALWIEVRYHEGRATAADVEAAIHRVNDLRRLAHDLRYGRKVGFTFSWREARPLTSAGN